MDHSEHASSGHGPDSWLQHLPGLPHDPHYLHVNGAVVVFLFILVVSLIANRKLKGKQDQYLVPPKKLSFVGIFDMIVEGLFGMLEGVLGAHKAKEFFPFISSLFIFIFLCNLLGLTPMGSSPSSNINTTLAIGFAAFLYYNVVGIKEHGLAGYAKHFLMGLGLVGIPIAFLELISHFIRPISLGLRLFVNLHVDHTVVLSFQNIFAWGTTIPLLLFGIIVCTVQAFVFTILTAVYVQMATEH